MITPRQAAGADLGSSVEGTLTTPIGAGPSADGHLDEFVTAVLVTSWLLVGISARSVEDAESGITLTQFRTLAVLADRGETNLSKLAAELDVNASTAMRVIDRLVAANLVSRTENPATRREVVLCPTPAGEQLVRDVVARRRAAIAELVETIPADNRAALVNCLRQFHSAAETVGLRPAAPAALGW
ncbi:MAG: MarR family winged helix-turn-helix transcriptional regulator [Mycobacteriales bacterium]